MDKYDFRNSAWKIGWAAEAQYNIQAWEIRLAAETNYKIRNYPRAVELREKVLAEYESKIGAKDYFSSYVYNIALGDFERGATLREALCKKLDSSLRSKDLTRFHTDMERYADRIQHLLDNGALSEEEKRIYDSIFRNPEQDPLTAIEAYVESSSGIPDTRIKRILLTAAISLHLKAGNRGKALEYARRFWVPFYCNCKPDDG